MSGDSLHCLIVGAGHAGAQCALSLRKEGWTGEITLIGEEPHPPYHRPPLSKGYLKGETSLADALIRPAAVFGQNGIALRSGVRVEGIDRKRRRVALAGGGTMAYDRLVLATGSLNLRPPIRGLDHSGVFFLRTASDADALRQAAGAASRATIIGGGYIGLEVAASLRAIGLAVTVLGRGARVLSRVTSPEVSAFIHNAHREEGVDIRTGVAVERIERSGPALRVVTREPAIHEADLVVVGTGIAPNTALAESAGLAVDDGVCVDEHCRTSDPSVFAIGDCAMQYHPSYQRHVRLESVQNAVDQARTAAASMTGRPIPVRPRPWFWSDQYDMKLQIAGLFMGYNDIVLRVNPGQRRSCSAWYFEGRRLIAVDAVNDPLAYAVGSKLIALEASPDPARIADAQYELKTLLKQNDKGERK